MILDKAGEQLDQVRLLLTIEKASVVIPCHNEARTVGAVVAEARKSRLVNEVIVVDDGSWDGSAFSARKSGAKVVRHRKNRGKGNAILTGAAAASNSVLVFIDADLGNFTCDMLDRLAVPVLLKETRFCKSTFDRDGGRVTELVAKPLLEFIYPEAKFSQPLSGQFCVRKELLLSLDLDLDWGIDVSILLSALKKGEKVVEVNIGEIAHKHRELSSLAWTARDVTRTILQNAGFLAKRHRLIVFDFDGTLVKGSSIGAICSELGLSARLEGLRQMFYRKEISERALTHSIAGLLRGCDEKEFASAASKVQPVPYALQTLEYLKRMGYRTAAVSFAFRRSITSVFPHRCFDEIISPVLLAENGRFTGKARVPLPMSGEFVFSKGLAVRRLMRKLKVKREETIAVGNAESDIEMFNEAGIGLSINTRKKLGPAARLASLSELLVIAN